MDKITASIQKKLRIYKAIYQLTYKEIGDLIGYSSISVKHKTLGTKPMTRQFVRACEVIIKLSNEEKKAFG